MLRREDDRLASLDIDLYEAHLDGVEVLQYHISVNLDLKPVVD